jgi:cell division protein FtsX
MKVRYLAAVFGIAIALGTVVFMRSLVATNDNQSLSVAKKLLATVKVSEGAYVSAFVVDYRPQGRVMQGPPIRAFVATDSKIEEDGVVVAKALFAQRKLDVPPIGSDLKFVGRKGAYSLKLKGVIDWDRPLRGYPNAFVSPKTAGLISEQWVKWKEKKAEDISPGFMSDSQRNFDRAKTLLLWAAALSAFCLLLNSLLLSIEDKRREIAIMRIVGADRFAVVKMVLREALALSFAGGASGAVFALAALWLYVSFDSASFPSGMAVSFTAIIVAFITLIPIVLLAVAFSLKSALSVRPLEAQSKREPRKKHLGMFVSFACGFGAFVAVEVWGSSLMSAFIPSKEWPDAIVSILPVGVSSFDIEKLSGKIEGVKMISELQPLQVNILPLEKLSSSSRFSTSDTKGAKVQQYRNALLLASDILPQFKFTSSSYAQAAKELKEGDNCVITEMMARARNLALNDILNIRSNDGHDISLKIVGIVDLNWHLVTSRGLLRGLNRMPVNTDGPVFVSFDTIMASDSRPAAMVKMTHLWLDFEKGFLDKHGVFEAGRIVENEIVRILGVNPSDVNKNTVRLHARDEISDGTLAHGVDIIGSMARVPFIFIAVVSLGFIAMLAASVNARRREFLVLRAVGASRWYIAAILASEAIKVAMGGILVGFLSGAVVGWLFTFATRAAMSNWGLPASFAIPFVTIAKGALGSLLFALFVALPASLLIIRRK